MATIGLAAAAALLVLATGCVRDEQKLVWHKDGARPSEQQQALYECEQETAKVPPTFGRSVRAIANETQEFATRCMNSKGFYRVRPS